jgi:hypothetical protein
MVRIADKEPVQNFEVSSERLNVVGKYRLISRNYTQK